MGYKVKLPIVCKVDNLGAIFLSNDNCSATRTKHVDVRCHCFREHVEQGILKIVFVRTDDNNSDLMTKNSSVQPFERHAFKLVAVVPRS